MEQSNKKSNVLKKYNLLGDMPHSPEAERALLGCILLDPEIQNEVVGYVTEDMFYEESHKCIFNAINTIIGQNKTVDLVTLTDTLEKQGTLEQSGGIIYITELTNILPSSANYHRYYDLVSRDYMLRKLIKGSAEIVDNCKTSTDEKVSLAFAEKTVYDISNSADTREIVKISDVIPDVMMKLDELSNDKSKHRGVMTGYKSLDYILNGFHESDLIILAARPAVGKTSLAMNIVENIAQRGLTCAVFSLEMNKEQLGQRLLCSVAGVSMENASKGKLNKTEWLKIAKAREILANSNIYIDDSSIVKAREILSKCRRLKKKCGLDFVMIDYVQLMNAERRSENRQQEITEISRNLKILAKEVNVPVLALSQLSRAVESEKRRPQLSDLRESGAIEQDADIVLFIHRPDIKATEKEINEGKVQRNVAEIIVAKHRSGPTGLAKLYFRGECTKFVDLDGESGEPILDKDITEEQVSDLEPVAENNDIDEIFN